MQVNGNIGNIGYMGSGLNPFIHKYGAMAHAGNGPFGPAGMPQMRSGTVDTAALSDTFAQDVVNRISTRSQEQQAAQNTAEQPQQNSKNVAQTPKDTSALEQSLSSAVDYVRSNFGDAAAQATMGMVYKSIGNGDITEESLGKGLLDAVRFMDRNFGFAAGDKLMAHFNQGVNKAMNDYFDNGLMETFYAVSPGAKGHVQGLKMTAAMQEVAKDYGQEAVASIMESLQSALESGEKPGAALRQAVQTAGHDMAAQYGGKAQDHAALIGQALAPLLHGANGAAPPPLQNGGQLDIRV